MGDVQDHADGYLTLLRADPDLTVYDGRVPNDAIPPYVLVYTTLDDTDGSAPERGDSLDGTSGGSTARAYCHQVGGNQLAARAVAQRVRTDLLNQRPAVSGRGCGLIRQDFSSPSDRDETTGTEIQDIITVYQFRSVPA